MKGVNAGLARIAVACALVGCASVAIQADNVGATTNAELAQVRRATAQYHDVNQALADGYVSVGFNAVEGFFEYVNFALVDCTFDPLHPEGLRYVASGNGLRLAAVEYSIPKRCTSTPPEGFDGDADQWGTEPGRQIWSLGAFIWSGNPDGVFGSTEEGGAH